MQTRRETDCPGLFEGAGGGESLSDGTCGDTHCAHMVLGGKKLIRCWTETPEHVYAETSLATPLAGSGSKVIVSLWLI